MNRKASSCPPESQKEKNEDTHLKEMWSCNTETCWMFITAPIIYYTSFVQYAFKENKKNTTFYINFPWRTTSCEYTSLFLSHVNSWCAELDRYRYTDQVEPESTTIISFCTQIPSLVCFCVNIETCILYWRRCNKHFMLFLRLDGVVSLVCHTFSVYTVYYTCSIWSSMFDIHLYSLLVCMLVKIDSPSYCKWNKIKWNWTQL